MSTLTKAIIVTTVVLLFTRGICGRHAVEASKRDIVKAETGNNEVLEDDLTLPERWNEEGPMADAMLYISERSRRMFINDCLNGRSACTYDLVGETGKYRWNSDLSIEAKIRFWKFYECTLTKKSTDCPIDGQWSTWSSWHNCNATCGQGVRIRDRECDHPKPKNNGFKCSGPLKQEKLCDGACITEDKDVSKLSPPQQEAYAILRAKHAAHPLLLAKCYTKHCIYRDVQHIIDKTDADVYWSALHCFKYGNACPINGKWSEWTGWGKCNAACNMGIKVRTRMCNQPAPTANGNWCEGESMERAPCEIQTCDPSSIGHWKQWEAWGLCTKTCGGGVSVRKRECKDTRECEGEETQSSPCKSERCSVKGQWANWGTWNACSRQCGLGVSLRDRTCSNPIPSGSGQICKGPGTEIGYCYKSPCVHHSEKVAVFSGNSYIEYSEPSMVASRTLIVYIRFKPNSNGGILYQSFHKPEECKIMLKICSNKIVLELINGLVVLDSTMGDAKLKITSTAKILLDRWNTALVTLTGQQGTLTLNDKHHYFGSYTMEPSTDYNMPTLIGVGFTGAISKLTINFRAVPLNKRINFWKGHGSPLALEHVEFNPADIEATLPEFNGDVYSQIYHIHDTANEHSVQYKVIVKPKETLAGYIVYNEGVTSGSFTYLKLDESALKCCVNPGSNEKEACVSSENILPEKWYLIECTIQENHIEIRVDNNPPVETIISGQPYLPKPDWYVGGVPEEKDGLKLESSSRKTQGFDGYIDAFVIGDQHHNMAQTALVSPKGYVNAMGMSIAERFKDLYEPAASIVLLRCSYARYAAAINGTPVTVMWLNGTQLVRFDNFVKLEPDSPADKDVSVLRIDPPEGYAHQYESSYECLIFANNQFILKAYALTFKDKHLDTEEEIIDKAERTITITAIVFGPISVVILAVGIIVTLRAKNKNARKEEFKRTFERFADEVANTDEDEPIRNNNDGEGSAGSSLMSLARAAIKREHMTTIPSGLSIGSYTPNRNINMSQRRSDEAVDTLRSQGISKYGMENNGLLAKDSDSDSEDDTVFSYVPPKITMERQIFPSLPTGISNNVNENKGGHVPTNVPSSPFPKVMLKAKISESLLN
ncbi:unnamed protein product [Owenia fusiformis]|uniref:Laminin G domain-containing protein n=1 Tax=Owenia fusiformis TaxID=6347 RepID=A0A8S4Q2F6_OWEFU|nr:unnamed protein product [Owenia fusiformis]